MIADGLSRIAMSSGLATSLSRATDYARAQGHGEVTLEHMLLALCDDPDAVLVLAASNVNVAELTGEVGGQLAALPRRPPGQDDELVVASDLRRILEAAAAAARGGRRREINGAIVLAAIVGDGKSAASQILSSLGLTFEGAIRALQRSPESAPGQRALPAPDAEAILADARERIQSRTGLSARRLPVDGGVLLHEEVDQTPALRPTEPMHEPPFEAPHEPLGYEPEPTYERQPEPEPAFEAALASEPDQYREVKPQQEPAYEPEPRFSEESYGHDGSSPMPASAPFPPPIPLPDEHASWMPAPSLPLPGQRVGMALPPAPPAPMMPPAGAVPRPGPPPLAPWTDATQRSRPEGVGAGYSPTPTRASEALALRGDRFALDRRPAPQTAARPAGRPVSPRTEIGQLVENIPRSMRVAVPVMAEVRIARADVQALAEGLQGGGAAYQHEVTVTKAMSVRLRAPDGGFFIETASPETQWIERAMLLSSDDFASWRWHVTPREKGRRRLQLIISARTVSTDGLAAETALPDQVITVRVRTNYAKVAGRWIGWSAAAVIGGLLAKFGEGAFDAGLRAVFKIVSG
jgi:hypothetical protein